MKYDYQKFFVDWKNWDAFNDESRFDNANGVYAFRLKSEFVRLKGTSKVLYIGMCNQNPKLNRRPGLWHRLKNYTQKNNGSSERLKNIEEVFGKSNIEYSYVICMSPYATGESPREVEKALLYDYYEKHIELPPMNRSK